jgi:Siphovirus Gp157
LRLAKVHNIAEGEVVMASIAAANSLFEIDSELDELLEEIEGQVESEGQASEDVVARFQQFCEAHGEKVDRIGHFLRMMETREQYCRCEAARLADRARAAAGKVERTKNMVLYYLLSRDLKKIEGRQFTLRAQNNSQDSVKITDQAAVPKCYCRIEACVNGVLWETVLSLLPDELAKELEASIQETRPDNDAIKMAVAQNEVVPGAEVRRGTHLRVA